MVAVSFIGRGNRKTWKKTTDLSQVTDKLHHIMLYRVQLAWVGFKLTKLVVIGTDCIGSCKSNYHTITTTTVPIRIRIVCTATCVTMWYCISLKAASRQDQRANIPKHIPRVVRTRHRLGDVMASVFTLRAEYHGFDPWKWGHVKPKKLYLGHSLTTFTIVTVKTAIVSH